MNEAQITEDLREDEGEVLHAYKDSLGYLTIGVGILIDQRKGGGITKEESAYLLANHIRRKAGELLARAPWVADLNDARQGALVNMCFQMGVEGVLGFRNSLALIRAGKFEEAGAALKQSKWYGQTPNRAARVIKQIVTGEFRNGS